MELGKIKKQQYSPNIILYKWQDGSEDYYLPDFKVFRNDGSFYYIQVKGTRLNWIRESGRK